MNSILFATDGSRASMAATDMVKDYLQAWPEAELFVLYVTVKDAYPYDFSPNIIDEYENQIASDIKKDIKDRLENDDMERIHFIHKTGHAGKTVSATAEENDVDLIMMGSHGRGLVDRALLGSVARSVLNRTNRSVLVVR